MDYVLGAEIKGLLVRTYTGSRWRTTFSIDTAFPSPPELRFPTQSAVWAATLGTGDDDNVATWDVDPADVNAIPDKAYCELWIEDEVWSAGEVKRSGPS